MRSDRIDFGYRSIYLTLYTYRVREIQINWLRLRLLRILGNRKTHQHLTGDRALLSTTGTL